ncbi:MAG: GNAT family N-acetyltransferase [Cyclobacteriaceae bacterium]|nr:GNAT family N-acetyltransferase [Cyclobacteriaceae bacterium]
MKYLLNDQQSERLIFQEISLADYPEWLTFHQDPRSSLHWHSEKEDSEIACKKWYKKQFHRYENNLGGMNALIEKASGKFIGHCGLLVQQVDDYMELEIAYSLLPEFWRNGYATEAARKCRDYAFAHNFSESLISIISLTNKPSENVAIKNGMALDKVTIYNNNSVNIYRVRKTEWIKYSQSASVPS